METLPKDKNYKKSERQCNNYFYFKTNLIILYLWITIQCCVFIYNFIVLYYNKNSSHAFSQLGYGFLIAKTSAILININFMLLFLFANKSIISYICNFYFLPDIGKNYHIAINISILFFIILHCGAHFYNFYIIDKNISITNPINTSNSVFTNTVAGITGIILICLFTIIYTFSIESIRRLYYELFMMTHLLYIFVIITLLFHGSFCFFKNNDGTCNRSWFTKWSLIVSFTLFISERLYREYISRKETFFINMIKYSSDCTYIQLYKPFFEFKPGQWVLVNCPSISKFQWHPFTITSNPIENGNLQLFIKEKGQWTKDVIEYIHDNQYHQTNIKLKISNPYGQRYDIITKYRVAVLIASGIGITPFMSLFKALPCNLGHGNNNVYLKKVYLYWVCRNIFDFDCFINELKNLKVEMDKYGNLLELNLFVTGLQKNYNRYLQYYNTPFIQFKYNRPNFNTIFDNLNKNHPNTTIKLLFCGSEGMNNTIKNTVNKFNNNKNTSSQFVFTQSELFN